MAWANFHKGRKLVATVNLHLFRPKLIFTSVWTKQSKKVLKWITIIIIIYIINIYAYIINNTSSSSLQLQYSLFRLKYNSEGLKNFKYPVSVYSYWTLYHSCSICLLEATCGFEATRLWSKACNDSILLTFVPPSAQNVTLT
jgi:hypothetical protein